jgi:hypothetical protein
MQNNLQHLQQEIMKPEDAQSIQLLDVLLV